jgi:hypothetical protein
VPRNPVKCAGDRLCSAGEEAPTVSAPLINEAEASSLRRITDVRDAPNSTSCAVHQVERLGPTEQHGGHASDDA